LKISWVQMLSMPVWGLFLLVLRVNVFSPVLLLCASINRILSMRIVIGILVALFLLLQYRLWVGEGSMAEVHALKKQVEARKAELEMMQQRNNALRAEVQDLKKGRDAIEERARSELGMVRENEEFYQIVDDPKKKDAK
jgi:cell division protein FtsB